jgi:hypothetical protein
MGRIPALNGCSPGEGFPVSFRTGGSPFWRLWAAGCLLFARAGPDIMEAISANRCSLKLTPTITAGIANPGGFAGYASTEKERGYRSDE